MNQWLLNRYLSSQPPLRLERLQSGRVVSIVLAHSQQSGQPLWIMKTSSDPDGMQRLRLEGEALHYLKPWARELGTPELLEWQPDGQEVCLVRSVMPGKIYPVRLLLSSSLDQLEVVFRQPLDWLKRFRKQVKPPTQKSIASIVSQLSQGLRDCGNSPMRALAEYLEGNVDRVGTQNAPVIHGDFFPPNILLDPAGKLTVVDWDHFGVGSHFRDELNLLVGSNFVARSGRAWDVDEIWRTIMFSGQPIASFLKKEMNVGPEEERFYHYCYVAWQATEGAPMERARWMGTLSMLEPHGFPGPGNGPRELAPAID